MASELWLGQATRCVCLDSRWRDALLMWQAEDDVHQWKGHAHGFTIWIIGADAIRSGG